MNVFSSSKNVCIGVCVCSGDVPGGDWGDPGCDRAVSVHPGAGAALQTDRSLHLQPSLPGKHHITLVYSPKIKSVSWITLKNGEHRRQSDELFISTLLPCVFVSGSGAGSLLLEQRVHPQSDRGELSSHPAAGIRHPLQSLQGALEPVSVSHMSTHTHRLTHTSQLFDIRYLGQFGCNLTLCCCLDAPSWSWVRSEDEKGVLFRMKATLLSLIQVT